MVFVKSIKRKSLKKTACVLTAGMMLVSSASILTGCQKKESSSNTAVSEQQLQKSLSFTTEEMAINSSLGSIVNKNGLMYSSMYDYTRTEDTYRTKYSIVVFDTSGIVQLVIPVYEQQTDNEYGYIMGDIMVDDDGNISCMLEKSTYDDQGNYKNSTQLLSFDAEGNQIASLDLENVITEEDNDAGRWMQGALIDSQGYIYCNLATCVRVLDNTGNVLFTTPEIDRDTGWMNNMILTNTGVPAVYIHEYSENSSSRKLVEIDVNAQSYGAEHDLTQSFYSGSLYSGSGDYIAYSSTDTGVAGIRADNLRSEPVLNLLSLGVNSNSLDSFTVCDDGSFIMSAWDWSGYTSQKKLTFVKPSESEVKEKKIINFGCFSLDWSLRSAIAEFNKTNGEYIINVSSYSESNDTSDYEAAVTAFNNELLSGKVPDIIAVDSNMPMDSYISKGLFTDLYELIDNDPVLPRSEFLPNVLRALEKKGKLYYIAPYFSISTYAAKTSLVGSADEFTLEKSNEILAQMSEQMGEDVDLFNYYITKSDFLNYALSYNSFVDYDDASCRFDTPEFKAVLEAASKYPDEIDYDKLYNDNPNYWMDQEKACREGKALLCNSYIYDFSSYNRIKNAYFGGEDVTFVGFPHSGSDYDTAKLEMYSKLAISDKSKYKEGAWEFIRGIIQNVVTEEDVPLIDYSYSGSDTSTALKVGDSVAPSEESSGYKILDTERRYTVNYGNLPVLTQDLTKLGKDATIPSKYVSNGEIVESENYFYIGDEEIKLGTMTQADVDELIAFINTVDGIYDYDESLNSIITEEASSYFAGTKSVDETAATIQSRASIYMSEQYG